PLRCDARADPAARATDPRFARSRRDAREPRARLAAALPDGCAVGELLDRLRSRPQRGVDDLSDRAGRADQCAAARAAELRRDRRLGRRRSGPGHGRGRRLRPAGGLGASGPLRAARARRPRRASRRPLRGREPLAARRAARGQHSADDDGAGMIKVLLVDDHAVVRTGFRLLLQTHGEMTVVGESASGEEACRLYTELEPDVVLLDIAMPGMGGLEALKRIRARDHRARVLALSAHDDPMHARRALREGALGFLSKRSAPETLIEAISAVAAGKRFIDAEVARKLALDEIEGGGSPLDRLSEREFDVFLRLARGATVQRIAE